MPPSSHGSSTPSSSTRSASKRRGHSGSYGMRLIELRVIRHRRDERELAALAMQHRAPELVRVGRERVVGLGRDDDPRALLELALELSRAPAGVAGEDARP